MNKKKKKLNNKGFTLVETVASLLIITLLTGLVITISNMAKDAYFDFEMNAEGQILTSTLIANIQDELRYTEKVNVNTSAELDSDTPIVLKDGKSGMGYDYSYYSNLLGYPESKIVAKDGVLFVESRGSSRSLTGNSAYVMDLEAEVHTYYVPLYDKVGDTTVSPADAKDFYVRIIVRNTMKDTVVIDTSFIVEPLNKKDLPGKEIVPTT